MKNSIISSLIFLSSLALNAIEISPLSTPPSSPRTAKRLSAQSFSLIEEENARAQTMSELEHCKAQLSAQDNQQKIAAGKVLLQLIFGLNPTPSASGAMLSKAAPSIKLPQLVKLTDIQLNFNNPARKKEFAQDIMWALYDIAAKQKSIYFTEGTFVIEDPGLKLKRYLESVPGVYKRLSTHFNAFKRNEWTDMHNGLDLDDLPCNKKHVLFDALTDQRTFIKPENFGLEKIDHIIGHLEELIIAKARKIEYLRTLFNLEADNAAGWSKERTPKEILNDYKKLITEIETDKDTKDHLIKLANQFGIQKIVPTLESYMKDYTRRLEALRPLSSSGVSLSSSWHEIPSTQAVHVDQLQNLLLTNLNKIDVFLQTTIGHRDNPQMRSGEEIVISRKDMEDALASLVTQKSPMVPEQSGTHAAQDVD